MFLPISSRQLGAGHLTPFRCTFASTLFCLPPSFMGSSLWACSNPVMRCTSHQATCPQFRVFLFPDFTFLQHHPFPYTKFFFLYLITLPPLHPTSTLALQLPSCIPHTTTPPLSFTCLATRIYTFSLHPYSSLLFSFFLTFLQFVRLKKLKLPRTLPLTPGQGHILPTLTSR